MKKNKEYLEITLGIDKQAHMECNILPNNLMIIFLDWMKRDSEMREILILSVANYLQTTGMDVSLIKRLVEMSTENTEIEIPAIDKTFERNGTSAQ